MTLRDVNIFLSLDYTHVRCDLVVFPEVPLSLDCLVEEGEDYHKEKSVEDAEDRKSACVVISIITCSNKYFSLSQTDSPDRALS